MHASLRALLTGIIDYAGLFPPAGLPMEQSVRNYLSYRQEAESWMLGRFVCPASRLGELAACLGQPVDAPLALQVLGSGGRCGAEFWEKTQGDLHGIANLGSLLKVDGFEVRLPLDFVDRLGGKQFSGYAEAFQELQTQLPGRIFFEMESWDGDALLPLLSHLKNHLGADAGFKLRTGGLQADAFPTPEQVARTIAACRDAGVPLKFTAGMHHPLRHFDAGMQCSMHGFVNVFAAGVLARACRLNEEQLVAILKEEQAASFYFDDAGMRWRDSYASLAAIEEARLNGVVSFGSCSFDEPRQDLQQIGWLG